jgi:tetratricopeptide (TPR) repeat protein
MSSAIEGRYEAIERAYGEGRFSDALERGEALLSELQGPNAAPETQAVLGRLQLLTGHIHLYGLGQPDEARAYYQAVAHSSAPSTLVDLAQAGLKRCEEDPAASAGPTASTQAASPVTPEGIDLPATPWLNQLSEPQEALSAVQAAWRDVPASGHAAP